jgi:hypothetical protein
MNEGIYDGNLFYEDSQLSEEKQYIIDLAYELLVEAGFNVNKNEEYFNIDIFNMNTSKVVNNNYAQYCCDDDISRLSEYNSCVFYTQKDKGVKGDLDIYMDDKIQSLPTSTGLVIVRSGNQIYDIQPKTGEGKEHIITVCFSRYY